MDRKVVVYTGWASVATYASFGRFPVTVALTGAIAGSAAAGHIAALLAILMPFFLLPQAAAVLSFADVARDRAAGRDAAASVRLMCRTSAWISALIIPICCLFGGDVIDIVLGPQYRSALTGFLVLILCLAPQLTALPAGQALAARGAVVANATCAVGGFAVLLAGLYTLAAAHGALGAAIALGASMIVTGTSVLYLGHRRFGIGWREVSGSAAAIVLGLVAIALDGTPLTTRAAIALVVALALVVAAARASIRSRLRPLTTQ